MGNALGVFAKHPRPGFVKSRLAAATSPEWAAKVAEAFLMDWLQKLKGFPARTVLVHSPPEAREYFAALAEGAFDVEGQTDGDLGVRMEHFLTQAFAGGAQRAVIIGTDSPTLPLEIITQAFARLGTTDVVLGPATDGGYYLIGCARKVPDLFREIDWGGAAVLQQTIERLNVLGNPFALLREWYDVDTLDDWKRLCREVEGMRAKGIDPGIPHTEELVS